MTSLRRLAAVVAVGALAFAACGGPAAPSPSPTANPARAEGFRADNLGDGRTPALPEGTLYIQFLDIPQPGGGTLTHSHIAGYVYVIEGSHRLAIAGAETKDLKAGQAGFVPADTKHTHENPDETESRWYFISIRPNTARAGAPPFPGQKELFGTSDLAALPGGAYTESLRLVTLQPNGRTSAHKHGGLEAIVVMDGAIELHVLNNPMQNLAKGQGAYVQAGTVLQAINRGATPAKFLAFLVTKEGDTLASDVDTAP